MSAIEIPLAMVSDLLANLNLQSQEERKAIECEIAAELLKERDSQLLSKLRNEGMEARSATTVEKLLSEDRISRETDVEIDMHHRLSHAVRSKY